MLYFLRHPKTTWNIEDRLQGEKEGEITPKAREESKKFIENFLLEGISHIYHARNKRTRYLARLLKKKFPMAKVHIDKRLNERNFGIYEGMITKKVFSEYVNIPIDDFQKRFSWRPTSGESHQDVSERIKKFVQFLRRKYHVDHHVICVTSGGVIRNLLRIEQQLSLEKMYEIEIANLYLTKLG